LALLFYVRLIALTAGTLVYLFLLALILGHRRPRRFERLLFFLILSLFAIYAGGLLGINSAIQYGSPPEATIWLFTGLMVLGTIFLPPFVVHAHFEFARSVQHRRIHPAAWISTALLYFLALFEIAGIAFVSHRTDKAFGTILVDYANSNLIWSWALCSALAVVCQATLILAETDGSAKALGKRLLSISCLLLAVSATFDLTYETVSPLLHALLGTILAASAILPGAVLIYFSLKHNFLEYGAQRNLVYALSATFLALLYLALVHRVSGWLSPVMPPEATASVLLFVLIFLFEPLERAIGPALHRRFRERMSGLQNLTVDLQQEARHGDLDRLIAHAEHRIRQEFSLAEVQISIPRDASRRPLESPGGLGHVVRVPVKKGREEVGLLEAASTGSFLTGETSAGLEFLAEQLPPMADLCRLIEEKLRLERELAERERMAMLGQMAATVSHNLRNPLSSMKTILQVQLEKPELPSDLRHDCALVVGEIDRMSAKLKQLLNFAKPSVNGQRVAAVALAKQTAALFRHDAERRNVILELDAPGEEISVLASEEAMSEVFSNLIVNAIEAQPDGGRVDIRLAREGDRLEIQVEDRGPGVSAELRAKIFQPFFTTKVTGTGLGLAIVARRVDEMGGTMSCESPLSSERGARFRVTLPLTAHQETPKGVEDHANDSDRG
jgi:signal transduction histidine kinase